jgi:hypothetical protein
MFSLFKRKPRIIPFNPYRQPESQQVTPEKCKVFPFKANPQPSINPTGKCKITSFEYRNFENPRHCKLDFICNHLP